MAGTKAPKVGPSVEHWLGRGGMERREMSEAGREQGCEGKDAAALERSLGFIPSVRGDHQRASNGEF